MKRQQVVHFTNKMFSHIKIFALKCSRNIRIIRPLCIANQCLWFVQPLKPHPSKMMPFLVPNSMGVRKVLSVHRGKINPWRFNFFHARTWLSTVHIHSFIYTMKWNKSVIILPVSSMFPKKSIGQKISFILRIRSSLQGTRGWPFEVFYADEWV